MYQGDCARCGRKVRTDENYLKAHLWESSAAFHWSCLVALMKEHGETVAEDARVEGEESSAKWKNRSSVLRPLPQHAS